MRKKIPTKTKILLKYKSLGLCSICHREGIVFHHLDEDRNNNDLDNLIPLCPNHHDLVHSKHKLTQNWGVSELKSIRDKFYSHIEEERRQNSSEKLKEEKGMGSGLFDGEVFQHLGAMKASKGGFDFSLSLSVPDKIIKEKKMLFDISRFCLDSWDFGFVLMYLNKANEFKQSEESVKFIDIILVELAKILKMFYTDNDESYFARDFSNTEEFEKMIAKLEVDFIKNTESEMLEKLKADVEVKVTNYKVYESLFSQVNLFSIELFKDDKKIFFIPVRLNMLKEINDKNSIFI